MLLLEHQGKALLRDYGIDVPRGTVVTDEAALLAVISRGGGKVLKAQVATGGRGKAGAVRFADGESEARAAYAALRAMTVGGHAVDAILVEDRIAFERERYAGVQVENGRLSLLFARRGGVDIETITAGDPANFRAIDVDVVDGPDAVKLRETFAMLGYREALWPSYEAIAGKLLSLARGRDLTMVEINPLVETANGALIALDARVVLDETALDRQPGLAALLPRSPDASGAAKTRLQFKDNPAGGSIALIGFGSGLNITLMDWIASEGGSVGTLVDIDAMVTGGQGEAGFTGALDHMEQAPAIRSGLVTIISCGNRMDDIVGALLAALRNRPPLTKPLVLHLRGHRMAVAQGLLDEAGLRNTASLAAAVAEVVAAGQVS